MYENDLAIKKMFYMCYWRVRIIHVIGVGASRDSIQRAETIVRNKLSASAAAKEKSKRFFFFCKSSNPWVMENDLTVRIIYIQL